MTRSSHHAALVTVGDLAAAVGLLSRLPIPVDAARATARGARAAWAWPLAGGVVAVIAAAVAGVTTWIGLPPGIAALLLIATQVAVTGALHEDGLADSIDGLWGGWDRDRRLAIMKDSHIGTFGVLGLLFSVLLRWQAWSLLLLAGPILGPAIAVAALSRLPMVTLAYALPPARATGLSRSVGRPPLATLMLACAITLLVACLGLGWSAVVSCAVVALVTLIWARIAQAKIGGQTGDILGAAQQIAEVATLMTLVALTAA